MKIFIKGVNRYLECLEDAELEMVKANPLFSFGEKADERTTEMAIPATRANNDFFTLSSDPRTYGHPVRQKYESVLFADNLVATGTLHVLDYNPADNVYNAVFTFADRDVCSLLDSLKLTEIIKDTSFVYVNNESLVPAKTSLIERPYVYFAKRYFYNTAEDLENSIHYLPSFLVQHIINKVNAALAEEGYNVRIDVRDNMLDDLIYLPNTLHFFNKSGWFSFLYKAFVFTFNEPPIPNSYPYTMGNPSISAYVQVPYQLFDDGYNAPLIKFNLSTGQPTHRWLHSFIKATADLYITFPKNTDYFLLKHPSTIERTYWNDYTHYFIGERWFNLSNPNVSGGERLAGRTVKIPAGSMFIVVQADWWVYADSAIIEGILIYEVMWEWADASWTGCYPNGWYLQVSPYTMGREIGFWLKADVTIQCSKLNTVPFVTAYGTEYDQSGVAYASANLPDMSVLEFLQEVSNFRNLALYPNNNRLVIEKTSNTPAYLPLANTINLSHQLIQRNNLTRSILDFKQHNYIRFKKANNAGIIENIDFPINNASLDTENKIYEIEAVQTTQTLINNIAFAQVNYEDLDDRAKYGACFMQTDPEETEGRGYYALYATLTKNHYLLDGMCQHATQIEIDVRMSANDFEQMKYNTIFYFDNLYWTWSEGNWADGIATITLQQIF